MCVPWRLHHQRALCITSRACQARDGRCIHVMWTSKCMMAWLMACAHDIELARSCRPLAIVNNQPTMPHEHTLFTEVNHYTPKHISVSQSTVTCVWLLAKLTALARCTARARPSDQGRVQCSDLAERVQKKYACKYTARVHRVHTPTHPHTPLPESGRVVKRRQTLHTRCEGSLTNVRYHNVSHCQPTHSGTTTHAMQLHRLLSPSPFCSSVPFC